MNAYEKIVADITPYFSTPCAVKFKTHMRDVYFGLAEGGIDGFFSKVPRQKKVSVVEVSIHFTWISRIHEVRSLLGDTNDVPVGKIKFEPPSTMQLILVESKIETVSGIQKALLTSRAVGEEKFLISRDARDLERLKKWHDDNK